MTTFAEVRALKLAGAAIAAVPHENWPERGIAIGGRHAAIVCHHECDDLRKADFTSFTYSQFHYCPTAKWDDWVRLAKRILEIDAAVDASDPVGGAGNE